MTSSGPNPYASPQSLEPLADLPLPEADFLWFRRRVRWAVAFLAPLAMANWAQFMISNAVLDSSFVARLLVMVGGLVLVPSLTFAWLRGDDLLRRAGQLLHRFFGGNTPLDRWLGVGFAALWMLPFAAAAGAVLWAAFLWSLWEYGLTPLGWFLFGLAGNALGAWCYLTLFYRWWKLRRLYP